MPPVPGLYACALALVAAAAPPSADTTQAERVLDLLRAARTGAVPAAAREAVLDSRGTGLVILQQNVSRKVSKDQYRLLLDGLLLAEPPAIPPVDGTEQSRRGVEGLQRDVRPSLVWGMAHVELLQKRLDALRGLHPVARALAMAAPFLPGGPPPDPRISIVMGGRAGAASLPGNEIYFDVLATSFKESAGGAPYPTVEEQIAFFAHEVHHLGYGPFVENERWKRELGPDEARAYDLLVSLLMEGSATYLINAGRDLGSLDRDPTYSEMRARAGALLETVAAVLGGLLTHTLGPEAYEKAIAPLTGNGLHVAGATLLAAIDRDGGLQAVFAVMRDPRRVLLAYDRAARNRDGGSPFSYALATQIALMGDR